MTADSLISQAEQLSAKAAALSERSADLLNSQAEQLSAKAAALAERAQRLRVQETSGPPPVTGPGRDTKH
jgi:hypothetical protein